jgi:hypothetical protein
MIGDGITNPRAVLSSIRNAIDDMMVDGDLHTTSDGKKINLRNLLGDCDVLLQFIPKEVLWRKECVLQIQDENNGRYKIGDAGEITAGGDREFWVRFISWDHTAQHETFSKLAEGPVRITVEKVR